MIENIRRVAGVEFLEQRRQPWMVVAIAANYLVFGGILVVVGFVFEMLQNDRGVRALMSSQSPEFSRLASPESTEIMLGSMVPNLVSIVFGVSFAVVALSSAYSLLHDRTEGTLPFLMLAPLSRFELLLGKVSGAMAIPILFHFVINGFMFFVASSFGVMESSSALLGGSAAWWLAFLVNVPLGTLFMGSLAVIFSALAPDPRTSYQLINVVLAIGSILLGYAVLMGVQSGIVLSLVITVGLIVATLGTLAFGASLMSRDYVG